MAANFFYFCLMQTLGEFSDIFLVLPAKWLDLCAQEMRETLNSTVNSFEVLHLFEFFYQAFLEKFIFSAMILCTAHIGESGAAVRSDPKCPPSCAGGVYAKARKVWPGATCRTP